MSQTCPLRTSGMSSWNACADENGAGLPTAHVVPGPAGITTPLRAAGAQPYVADWGSPSSDVFLGDVAAKQNTPTHVVAHDPSLSDEPTSPENTSFESDAPRTGFIPSRRTSVSITPSPLMRTASTRSQQRTTQVRSPTRTHFPRELEQARPSGTFI